jgi:hypothetical protein
MMVDLTKTYLAEYAPPVPPASAGDFGSLTDNRAATLFVRARPSVL